MKRDDYKKGLTIKLSLPLRVRCCECDPIPEGATIVLFDQVSLNRTYVGLYFEPDAPSGSWHHRICPIGELPIKNSPSGGFVTATGKARDIFPQGGFCLHKVKISGIQGEVTGEVKPEIFKKADIETI